MPGRIRVLAGPAGSGKTGRVLSLFTEELERGGRPLLVLPSSHRVREVRGWLLSQGIPPGLATIHTLESLLEMVLEGTPYGSRRLNAVETQALVEEVVRRVKPQLVYFADMGGRWGFSRVVARFLREAVVLGDGAFLASGGKRGGGLGGLFRDVQPPEKAQDLVLILEAYREVLEEKGLLDEPMAFVTGGRLVMEGKAPGVEGVTHFLMDGFYDFTLAQDRFVEALLRKMPRTSFTLLYDPGRPRLFSLPGRLLERLQSMGAEVEYLERGEGPLAALEAMLGRENRSMPNLDLSSRVFLIRGGGPWGEVRWVAYKVASLIREGVSPRDIGIVVRDLAQRREELEEALRAWGVPYYVTQHPALAEHPLVNLAVMLLKARLEDLPVNRLVSLALSSLVPLEVRTREEVLLLVDRVQFVLGMEAWKKVLARYRKDQRCRMASHWMTQTLIPALKAIPLKGPGRDMVKGVEEALQLLGVGEDPVLSFFREAMLWVVRGRELAGGGDFTLEEFLASLGGVLRESHYSPGVAREGVTVMGLLDGRQSSFSHLFFVGLHQGSFPAPVHADPLLRDGDRQGINRAAGRLLFRLAGEEKLEEESLLFYMGITRARDYLYLSYNARDEEGRPLSPSPFLLDLLEEVGHTVLEGDPPHPYPRGGRDPQQGDRVEGPFPLPSRWTPTHIETYAQCPYAFFLRYVLGIEPFRVPVEEALSTSIGELYHKVLEEYEKARLQGRGGSMGENLALMEEVAHRVFQEFAREGKVGHQGLFAAEAQRHLEVLRAFVRWETEGDYLPPQGVEVSVEGELGDVLWGGRVDRIQRREGEEWAIWDYKTGARYGFEKKWKKGLLFQPYIYAHLLEASGKKSCTLFRYLFLLHLGDRRKAYLDLEVSSQEREQVLNRALELVKKAREGWFPWSSLEVGLEETDDKCRYCLYRGLCRREDKLLGW